MYFNDMLGHFDIDPKQVLAIRHTPSEPQFKKDFLRLVLPRADLFNSYQQFQTKKVEKAMTEVAYLASFIGHQPGKAVFVGLYSIRGSKPFTHDEYWQLPAHVEMKTRFGVRGFTEEDGRSSILCFDLQEMVVFYGSWKGKLVVEWPPPEVSWWRRADRNNLRVFAVLEESLLDAAPPNWRELKLTWEALSELSPRWKAKLSEWRGIYYIFDHSTRMGYVGSAYGENNLLHRWLNYRISGDGGNALLRQRDPHNFEFTILERVSPDMEMERVVQLETTWKNRLHTRAPDGLNDN